jgi:hypothetical protein
MHRIATIIFGLALVLVLVTQSTPGWAASASGESTGAQIGYGTGSVVGSAVYFPFKASFCILGGIGSGFAHVFAGPEAAQRTANASCRGTWVITPNVVKGREPVHFVGSAPAGSPAARAARPPR